jgi:hypothetical protein
VVLVVLLLLSAALLAATMPGVRDHLPSWVATPVLQALAAWSAAGLLSTSAILSLPSYGLFVLPFAVLAVFTAAGRFSFGRGTLGLCVGAGLALIAVGLANPDYRPLPPSGTVSLAPGQTSVTYGGLNPTPWLVAGSILVVASLLIVVLLGRHQSRQAAVH